MAETTFYSSSGAPVAYTLDGVHIYQFDGSPVGYLHGESVYAFDGAHLGRFAKGWIRDNQGAYVFFTTKAQGGPIKPVRMVKPVKGVKRIKPVKAVRQPRPVRQVNQLAWSRLSGPQFFWP